MAKREYQQGESEGFSSRRAKQVLLVASVLSLLMVSPLLLLTDAELLDRGYGSDDLFYYVELAEHSVPMHRWLGASSQPALSSDGIHATNGVQPAWLVVVSILTSLVEERHQLRAILLLAVSLHLCAGWLLFGWLRRTDGVPLQIAMSAAVLWILHPRPMSISLEGTEGALLAFAWMLSLYVWCRSSNLEASYRRCLLLGGVLAFGVLVRVDFLVLALAVTVIPPFSKSWRLRPPKQSVLVAAPWIFVSLCWFAFAFSVTGAASVDSGAAKLVHRQILETSPEQLAQNCKLGGAAERRVFSRTSTLLAGAKNAVQHLSQNGSSPWMFVGLLLFTIVVVGANPLRFAKLACSLTKRVWPLALGVGLTAVYLATLGFVRSWYLIPVALLQVVVASTVMYGLQMDRWAKRVLLSVSLLFVWCTVATLEAKLFSPSVYSGEVHRFVRSVRSAIPPGATVGAFNSGIPSRLLSGRNTVVNLDGVVNRSVQAALIDGDLGSYLEGEEIGFLLDLEASIAFFADRSCVDWSKAFETVAERPLRSSPQGNLVLLRRKRSLALAEHTAR